MGKLKQAEALISQEVITLENKIAQLNEVIKLLKQKDNVSEEIEAECIPIIETVSGDAELKEKFKNYPLEDYKCERIRFTLNTFDRAISDAEFEKIITLMEGDKATETLETFQRTIRGLTNPKHGEIMQFHFVNNKTRLYCKPEWQGQDKLSVLKEKLPIPNELNLLDENILLNPICKFKSVK